MTCPKCKADQRGTPKKCWYCGFHLKKVRVAESSGYQTTIQDMITAGKVREANKRFKARLKANRRGR